MNTKELITNSEKVYNQFDILPNIREHMRRTAAVALYIIDHWQGPTINKDEVIAACLVHDLANIVKVDFSHPEMLGPEAQRLAHWQVEQAKAIALYGAEEHAATDAMLVIIEALDRIRKLVQGAVFANNSKTAEGVDWEQKIVSYTDVRVGPFGVISLHERLVDAKRRYAGKREFSTDKNVPVIAAAYSIEEQLGKNMNIAVDSITDETIAPYLKQL